MERTLDPAGNPWSVKRRWLPRREPLFKRLRKQVPRSIVVTVLSVTIVANVVLRRPWVIDAVRDDGSEPRHWKVTGWFRSREAVHQIQRSIASGTLDFQSPDVRPVVAVRAPS